MWKKKHLEINNYNAIAFYPETVYKESNLDCYKIKALVFVDQSPTVENAFNYLIIEFEDNHAAYKFYTDHFLEVILSCTNDYPGASNRVFCHNIEHSDTEFNLIDCNLYNNKLSELSKFRSSLNKDLPGLPLEFFDIITAKPKKLTDLEIRFYASLYDLSEDNFSELLNQANQVIESCTQEFHHEGYMYSSKLLWNLATECKAKSLIEEWIQTLQEISNRSVYYAKAQEELGFLILSQFEDNTMTKEEKNNLLNIGLKYAVNSMGATGIEMAKKMTLSFLGIEWLDQEQIFPKKVGSMDNVTNLFQDAEGMEYISDLIIYAAKLKEENYNLKQQLDLLGPDNSTSSSDDINPKLKINI